MENDYDDDRENKKPLNGIKNEVPLDSPCTKEERNEYFGKLDKWLHEVYAWQIFVATIPYYVLSNQKSNHIPGLKYRIPPVWKRFLAECIDAVMVYCLELNFILIAVYVFDCVTVKTYVLDMTLKKLDKLFIESISAILIHGLFHEIMVCIFEACWLQRGLNGCIGGATPGKFLMGLRVVHCCSVTTVEGLDNDQVVLVSPGTDLGLPLAFGRSLSKNLMLETLFPTCFAIFSSRFHRTHYDLSNNSIVVEDPYRNRNNNNQNNRFH